MSNDTATQILKRIEAKFDERPVCLATRKEYEEHCKFIDEAKVILPQFNKAIEEFSRVLAEGTKTFGEHRNRLTVIETEKKTALAIIGVIGGIIGGSLSFLISLAMTVIKKI